MSNNRERRRQESWKAADVKCPFYLRDSSTTLECEGFDEGMIVTLNCRTKEKKNKHMGIYCAGGYDHCPVYNNTMSKYAE